MLGNLDIHMQMNETKNHSQILIELHVNSEIIELLKEKRDKRFLTCLLAIISWIGHLKCKQQKSNQTSNKWDYVKVKICSAKEMTNNLYTGNYVIGGKNCEPHV